MVITTYNLHGRLLSCQWFFFVKLRILCRTEPFLLSNQLKLGFSLSGVILLLGTASPLPVRVFVLSTLTRSRLLLQCLSRSEESCSTANLPDARTVRASPDPDD